MTYNQTLALAAGSLVFVLLCSLLFGLGFMKVMYPLTVYGTLGFLAYNSYKERERVAKTGKGKFTLTAAADVLQGFGMVSMILGLAIGALCALLSDRFEEVIDQIVNVQNLSMDMLVESAMPLLIDIGAIVIEGFISTGIGIALAVFLRMLGDTKFGESEVGGAGGSGGGGSITGNLDLTIMTQQMRQLCDATKRAHKEMENLGQDVTGARNNIQDIGKLSNALASTISALGRIVESLNQFTSGSKVGQQPGPSQFTGPGGR